MMVTICSQCGTLSESRQYCDDCGARIEDHALEVEAPLHEVEVETTLYMAAPPLPPPAAGGRAEWRPELRTCPEERGGCGASRQVIGPFCKLCGFNFKLLQPATMKIAGAKAPRTPEASSVQPTRTASSTRVSGEHHTAVLLKAVVSCDKQLYNDLHYQDRQELVFPEHEPAMSFPIAGAEMLIGRASRQNGPEAQIMISTDPGVSRQHARFLLQENGTYAILDVSSAGGTLLNGRPIQGKLTPVKPGDVLVIGAWTRIDIMAQ